MKKITLFLCFIMCSSSQAFITSVSEYTPVIKNIWDPIKAQNLYLLSDNGMKDSIQSAYLSYQIKNFKRKEPLIVYIVKEGDFLTNFAEKFTNDNVYAIQTSKGLIVHTVVTSVCTVATINKNQIHCVFSEAQKTCSDVAIFYPASIQKTIDEKLKGNYENYRYNTSYLGSKVNNKSLTWLFYLVS